MAVRRHNRMQPAASRDVPSHAHHEIPWRAGRWRRAAEVDQYATPPIRVMKGEKKTISEPDVVSP
jgi:hypothetical protein